MELKSYLKSCSKILLRKICELSKDKKLIDYYEQYDRNLTVSSDVDYTWSLISTALLLSENLWKNESVYKNISNRAVDNIEDTLGEGTLSLKGNDTFNNNCLLDSHNKIANPININEIQDSMRLDEMDMLEYHMNKKKTFDELDSFEQSRMNLLDDIFENDVYGSNEALLTDGRIDYRKFIIRVRHALAHSNYEIINDDFIRLYHYNREQKKLDFNVALNKKLVITILDELNEAYYESGEVFVDQWDDYRSQYVRDHRKVLDEKEIIEQLVLFDILDEVECKKVLLKAQSDKEYKNSEGVDRLDIIFDYFLERIRPVCSYGIIVNEFLYGNNNGLIEEEYYNKLDIYKYFNSELFEINMDSNKDVSDKNKLELLIFAFLNSSLLNGVNLVNNEIENIIDFSKMQIREEDYKNAIAGKSKLVIDLNNKIAKLEKELLRVNNTIRNKMDVYHKNYDRKEEYFVTKLPNEIYFHIREKSNLIIEINNLYQKLQVSDLINISNYILTHLRNCLAHGYIKIIGEINMDNISETMLEFSDYNPDNKSELTFKGTIMLEDLIVILTDIRYVHNVLENDLIEDKKTKTL